MIRTRSWEPTAVRAVPALVRTTGVGWLLAASVAVVCGLGFAYFAKTQNFSNVSTLNLNVVTRAEELLPYLDVFQDRAVRESAAEQTFAFLRAARPLKNVGALSRVRHDRKPLLPLSRLKPLWAVRTPAEFRREFFGCAALYLGGFYLVWFAWRLRRFAGDPAILPALHLLSGIGLILMVSLRDPLRDTLEFRKFAIGVFLGCLLLLLPLFRAFVTVLSSSPLECEPPADYLNSWLTACMQSPDTSVDSPSLRPMPLSSRRRRKC
jgi:hypothetical protein